MARGNNLSPFLLFMEYVNIASLGKPYGLKGQMHGISLTSFPSLRFKKNAHYALFNQKGELVREVTLSDFRLRGDSLTIGFKEILTPEEALTYQGHLLALPKDNAPLPEGYVRYDELIGYKGVDDEGEEIGTLLEVVEYGAAPNLKFKKKDGKNFYVPFIDAFVGEIDHEKKTIRIHVIEGML